MFNVTVKRSEWLRGKGTTISRLIAPDDFPSEIAGKKCCLGFACEQAGIESKLLVGVTAPKSLTIQTGIDLPSQLSGLLTNAAPISGLLSCSPITGSKHSVECQDLMATNDNPELTNAAREARITEVGKQVNINFTFVD